MGKMEKTWNNFKYRCQNLLVMGRKGSDNVNANANSCGSVKGKHQYGRLSCLAIEQSLKRKCCLATGNKPFKEFFKEKPKLCH